MDERKAEFFRCILENDHTRLKSLLMLLPPEKLRLLSRNKHGGKTPLVLAVEKGFPRIVEELLDVCQVDINEVVELNGRTFTPLFVAIRTRNMLLVSNFVKLGADLTWKDNEDRNALVYACYKKNFCIAKLLWEMGANINCTKNVDLCLTDCQYFKMALRLGTDINYIDEIGNTFFMNTIIADELKQAQMLLNQNIDKYHRNHYGANIMDVLIFNNETLKIRYLLDNHIFTLTDKVLGYEFCGAYAIIYNSEFEKGRNFWLQAMKLRQKYPHHIRAKDLNLFPQLAFVFKEFDSLRDIDKIDIPRRFLLQALHVLVRILTPQNPLIRKSFLRVILSNHMDKIYEKQFPLIDQLFSFPSDSISPLQTSAFTAMDAMSQLCEKYFEARFEISSTSKKSIFEKLVIFVTDRVWTFLSCQCQFSPHYQRKYENLLQLVLRYVDSLWVDKAALKQEDDVIVLLRKTSRYFVPDYATTLLHIAIYYRFPFEIVALLADKVVNVNFLDKRNNIPLHLHLQNSTDDPDWERIALKLLVSGSNLDAKNDDGLIPRNALMAIDSFRHYISL